MENKNGLPIHATNKKNTRTFCGLKVIDGEFSYHNQGIAKGWIIDPEKHACKKCLEVQEARQKKKSK